MQTWMIFLTIWIAMIAHSFWESSAEGPNAWGKKMYGWKWKILKNLSLTRYHFWLFFIYLPILIILLPMVVAGFSISLFGILLSAYLVGTVIEDFFWFLVNPAVKFKDTWNPQFASYYPWLVVGKFRIPIFCIIGIGLAVLSWVIFVA